MSLVCTCYEQQPTAFGDLWWPILPSFNLAKVWDFHPLQNPESPDIPRPKERQKKKWDVFRFGSTLSSHRFPAIYYHYSSATPESCCEQGSSQLQPLVFDVFKKLRVKFLDKQTTEGFHPVRLVMETDFQPTYRKITSMKEDCPKIVAKTSSSDKGTVAKSPAFQKAMTPAAKIFRCFVKQAWESDLLHCRLCTQPKATEHGKSRMPQRFEPLIEWTRMNNVTTSTWWIAHWFPPPVNIKCNRLSPKLAHDKLGDSGIYGSSAVGILN